MFHCVKSVHIRSYSGPHFPAFGLNTERYAVFVYWYYSVNKQARIYLYTNIKTVMIKWQTVTKRSRTWTSLNFTKELRFSKKILGQNFGIFQLRHLLKIWKFKRSNKRLTLCKKYPYLELLWSGFSPNAGKYGPE